MPLILGCCTPLFSLPYSDLYVLVSLIHHYNLQSLPYSSDADTREPRSISAQFFFPLFHSPLAHLYQQHYNKHSSFAFSFPPSSMMFEFTVATNDFSSHLLLYSFPTERGDTIAAQNKAYRGPRQRCPVCMSPRSRPEAPRFSITSRPTFPSQ